MAIAEQLKPTGHCNQLHTVTPLRCLVVVHTLLRTWLLVNALLLPVSRSYYTPNSTILPNDHLSSISETKGLQPAATCHHASGHSCWYQRTVGFQLLALSERLLILWISAICQYLKITISSVSSGRNDPRRTENFGIIS